MPSHSPRTSATRSDWRAFDGQVVGALAANPGMKQQSYVMTQFGDVAGTLRARGDSSPNVDGGQNVVCMQDGQAKGGVSEDVSTTLNASHEQPIIIDRAAFNQGENAKYPPPYRADGHDGHPGGEGSARCQLSNGDEVTGALCARDWKGVGSQYVMEGKVVCQRR